METLDCVKTRRSIRKFKDIPIEMELLGKVLDAGRLAPSAGNLQDWKFILVKEQKTIEEIAKACVEQYWIATASAIIIVCTDPSRTESHYGDKGKTFSYYNGAAATMSMLLTIHDVGLASCWVSAFAEEMLKRTLKIPDNILIHAVIPIGYAVEKQPTRPEKFTLEDVTFIESYDNKIKDVPAYFQWYAEHVRKVAQKSKDLMKKLSQKLSE